MFKQLLACVEIVLPGKAKCVQTTVGMCGDSTARQGKMCSNNCRHRQDVFKQLSACVEIVLAGKARCVQTIVGMCGDSTARQGKMCSNNYPLWLETWAQLTRTGRKKTFWDEPFRSHGDRTWFISFSITAKKCTKIVLPPTPFLFCFFITSIPFLVHSGSLH